MSDLINRQQAIDVLEEQLDYLFTLNKKDNPTAESEWYGINWARNTIAELPTVDLVRCKECIHRIEDPDFQSGHFCLKRRGNGGLFCEDNDSCSYGEREFNEKCR